MRYVLFILGVLLIAAAGMWLLTPVLDPFKDLINPEPPQAVSRGGGSGASVFEVMKLALDAVQVMFAALGAFLAFRNWRSQPRI